MKNSTFLICQILTISCIGWSLLTHAQAQSFLEEKFGKQIDECRYGIAEYCEVVGRNSDEPKLDADELLPYFEAACRAGSQYGCMKAMMEFYSNERGVFEGVEIDASGYDFANAKAIHFGLRGCYFGNAQTCDYIREQIQGVFKRSIAGTKKL
ncbi:MAG: hypothetical protein COA52_18950, partial [Hyphomicrobiales bacterium]